MSLPSLSLGMLGFTLPVSFLAFLCPCCLSPECCHLSSSGVSPLSLFLVQTPSPLLSEQLKVQASLDAFLMLPPTLLLQGNPAPLYFLCSSKRSPPHLGLQGAAALCPTPCSVSTPPGMEASICWADEVDSPAAGSFGGRAWSLGEYSGCRRWLSVPCGTKPFCCFAGPVLKVNLVNFYLKLVFTLYLVVLALSPCAVAFRSPASQRYVLSNSYSLLSSRSAPSGSSPVLISLLCSPLVRTCVPGCAR